MGEICYAGDCVKTLELALAIWVGVSFAAGLLSLAVKRGEDLEIFLNGNMYHDAFSVLEHLFMLWRDGIVMIFSVVGLVLAVALTPIWVIPYAALRYVALKKWTGKDA